MDGVLLQDWVTIRAKNSGGTNITSIAQGADAWIDVGDHEDLTFLIDVRELTNAAVMTVYYETAPTLQEASFRAMLSFAPAMGQRVDRVFSATRSVPPARFVRWRLGASSGTGDWDMTFRVWLAAYAWVKT